MSKTLRSCVSSLFMCGLGAALVLACSGSSKPGSGFSDEPDASGEGGSTFGNDNGNGTGPGNALGDGGTAANLGDAACAASSSKGQQAPLDIYIMLDQSSSMDESVSNGGTKWDAVTGAINAFVGSPLNGVSVGLGYFAVPPGGSASGCVEGAPCHSDSDCGGAHCRIFRGTCSCSGGGTDSCSAADYAKPDVEIAALPGVQAAISGSMQKHGPSTGTPTVQALQGAINHATDWSKAHASDVTIVVLATDGEPEDLCNPEDITSVANVAAAGVSGTPKIITFVIGVGTSTSNLNQIAQSGGSNSAFIVDTNANAQQQFLDALNKIRGSALGCNYAIPAPQNGNPDFGAVNVQYKPANGPAQTIPKVNDVSQCPASGNAWYYDDNATPKQIILCKATCDTIVADASGEVDVLLGCATVLK